MQMDQMRIQEGDSGHTIQEHYRAGHDQAMGLSKADGVLLMELLEDSPYADNVLDDDVDRLSHVIRSLEAEIGGCTATMKAGGSESITGPPGEDVGGLDEMMVDLDGYGGAAFGYWPEVPVPVGHEVGDWYVGGEGSIVGYEVRDQRYYYCCADQDSVEQVYSPLWE